MCNFAIRVTEIDNDAKKYGFDIVDTNSFELNKYYSTLDRNPVRFYFVKNNYNYFVQMDGKISRKIYRRSLMMLDYNYEFLLRNCFFQLSKSTYEHIDHENDSSIINPYIYNKKNEKIPAPNIFVGEIIFIRSNLVYNCCG